MSFSAKLFARGKNYLNNLGRTPFAYSTDFFSVPFFDNKRVERIAAELGHTIIVADGEAFYMGWVLDESAQYRVFNFVDRLPWIFHWVKRWPRVEYAFMAGQFRDPGPLPLPGGVPLRAALCNGCSVYFLGKDGGLWVRGENFHGQLGVRDARYVEETTALALPAISALSLGRRFAVAQTGQLTSHGVPRSRFLPRDAAAAAQQHRELASRGGDAAESRRVHTVVSTL